jgi:hypothetical protein
LKTPYKSCLFLAGIVLLASACGGPASPTPRADDRTTAPATFSLTGTVRQSGEGPPLEGAAVRASSVPPISPPFLTTAPATITNNEGVYRFEGLTGSIRLKVEKEGYEPGPEDFFIAGGTQTNVSLQPTIVLPLGTTTIARLYPDDPRHTIFADLYGFVNCEGPCRLIRIVSSVEGRLRLRIRFLDEQNDLGVSVDGRSLGCCKAELEGTFYIFPARPLRVYVRKEGGALDRPRAFELSTEAQQ